jgi:hypothetical protein
MDEGGGPRTMFSVAAAKLLRRQEGEGGGIVRRSQGVGVRWCE